MIATRTTRLMLAAVMVAVSGCVRENPTPAPREFEFGPRRVQVIVPTGWEALDQGKQKRFRKGEFEIVLQNLGPSTSLGAGLSTLLEPGPEIRSPGDSDDLIEWGLAAVGHDQRRDVKSRHPVMIDGREAMDIETWNRLDHSNPQRILLVRDDAELLALHTVRMALQDSLAAFDAIRDSLHFVSDRR